VIGRPARHGRIGTGKAQGLQVKFFNKGIDRPHRVVLGDVVVEARRQQHGLGSIFPFDESLHAAPASLRVAVLYERSGSFHTPSAESGP
jgi:hypothetical protein